MGTIELGIESVSELNQHPECEIPTLKPPYDLNQVYKTGGLVLFRLPKLEL